MSTKIIFVSNYDYVLAYCQIGKDFAFGLLFSLLGGHIESVTESGTVWHLISYNLL